MPGFSFLRGQNATSMSDEERLERIAKTRDAIVGILSPEFIYVFGSAATGEGFDAQSDIDCFVVVEREDVASRSWKLFGRIRKQLGWALDMVCFSMAEFEKKRDVGGVAFIATHEGKLIYSRPEKESREGV